MKIYTYVCVCVCVCIYIYIYIREGNVKWDRDFKNNGVKVPWWLGFAGGSDSK